MANQGDVRVKLVSFWRLRWFGKTLQEQQIVIQQYDLGRWVNVKIIKEDVYG